MKWIQTDGFAQSREARKPPPGGVIEWPSVRKSPPEVRRKVAAALRSLTIEKGLDNVRLAEALYGTSRRPRSNYTQARNNTPVRRWLAGAALPNAEAAVALANYFGKPMRFLLDFEGDAPPVGSRPRDKTKSNGKGNGHARLDDPAPRAAMPAKVKPEPPPPRPLPEGAEPLALEFKTWPGDPDFATISITGTASLDACLGLIAFIERHRSPRE